MGVSGVIRQVPLLRGEFQLMVFQSDLRRRAASRWAVPHVITITSIIIMYKSSETFIIFICISRPDSVILYSGLFVC